MKNIIVNDANGIAVEIAELNYDKFSKILAYRYSPFVSYKFSKALKKFKTLEDYLAFRGIQENLTS